VGELVAALADAGLSGILVVRSFDPFRGSARESTARQFGVRGVNVVAVKPRG
jgi:hypothetical protein